MVAALSLRRGEIGEAETLFALHKESAIAAYAQVFPADRYAFPDDEMRRQWDAALRDPATVVVIAARDDAPVGFVTVSEGWLRNLFVVPDEWGRGAGDALHDEAVRLLAGFGAGGRLWVLEANGRARRFYERHGWRADGVEGRSEYPPYPRTLRYSLAIGAAAPGGTHP